MHLSSTDYARVLRFSAKFYVHGGGILMLEKCSLRLYLQPQVWFVTFWDCKHFDFLYFKPNIYWLNYQFLTPSSVGLLNYWFSSFVANFLQSLRLQKTGMEGTTRYIHGAVIVVYLCTRLGHGSMQYKWRNILPVNVTIRNERPVWNQF